MPDSESDQPGEPRKNVPPGDASHPEQPTPSIPPPPPPGVPMDSIKRPPAPAEPEVFGGILGGEHDEESHGGGIGGGVGRAFREGRKILRSEMGFLEHLEELRMTIIKSLLAAFGGMVIVSIFFVAIFDSLRYPLKAALGEERAKTVLISPLEPMGTPMMVISVSVYGGIVLALPLIAYFIVRFIAPGLTMREKKMLRPTMLAGLALFIIGMLACFFILLPAALRFADWTNSWLSITTTWGFAYYYSTVVWSTLATGLVFEFPLVLVIMQALGIIETATLRRGRRYAVVIILVIGGFIAPSPDPGSMMMMAVPMYLLYEGAIVVGAWQRRRRLAAEAAAEAKRAADSAG